MDEGEARKLLRDACQDDSTLKSVGWYLWWWPGAAKATLDGEFTADELEAIAWWMRNQA